MKNSGFSLVELSIVLVILGLLTGGILGGQALIRAAELRSVTQDVNKYVTAVNTFRNKYLGLPGDLPNAESFWSNQGSCPGGLAGNGTCNGNGNGQIGSIGNTVAERCEAAHAWKQMMLAGLIEGWNFQTTKTSDCDYDSTPAQDVPASKISRGMFNFNYVPAIPSSQPSVNNYFYSGRYGHVLFFGSESGPFRWEFDSVITPEDAWNIDTKVDDGSPSQGNVRSPRANNGHAEGAVNCATNQDPALAEYSLAMSSVECGLIFILGF